MAAWCSGWGETMEIHKIEPVGWFYYDFDSFEGTQLFVIILIFFRHLHTLF